MGKYLSIDKAKFIGVHEGRLYRVITPSPQALVHMEINAIKLWHRSYGHIHYKIIPSLSQIENIKEDREGVCEGCALGKKTRKPLTRSDLIRSNLWGQCLSNLLEAIFM